jgi:uncharacterized protein
MKKLFLFLLLISVGYTQPQLPELKSYANDFTGTLDQEQLSNLNYRLQTFDDSTSNQLVLLVIPTLNDYPLDEYANETAEKNKIGTKKNDNGILFVIVKDDKKIRIEVGYGLEGALPDALASSIIRNVVVPYFKRNDYYGGISEGIDAIILATKGEYKAEEKSHSKNHYSGIITFIIIIFFLISSIFRGGRRRGGGFFFPGGFGGGGFSSGGFGGGGGGGFGGGGFSGGGGGFGGGGASGGW